MSVEFTEKLSDRVKRLLLEKESRRNSDRILIAAVWYQEIKGEGLDPNTITGTELLRLFTEGKLSHTESIRRTRAKLQEEDPETYGGTNQDYKHDVKEPEIRGELRQGDLFQ